MQPELSQKNQNIDQALEVQLGQAVALDANKAIVPGPNYIPVESKVFGATMDARNI